MEDKNKNVCGMDCACNDNKGSCCGSGSGHGCWGHGKHGFMRKLFWIVIVLIIFCSGVQIGEVKGELRAYHNSYKMMSGYGDDYGRYKMMKDWSDAKTPLAPAVTTPTTQ